MKLYTEEQVRNAIADACADAWDNSFKVDLTKILNQLTPIELPSDEEIEDKSIEKCFIESPYIQDVCEIYFQTGAKWMKEQILGKEDKTFKQKSKWTEVDNMTRRLK